MTIDVTDSTFSEVVLSSDKPVVVDFWAEWCGPCRMVSPVLVELSEDYKDKIVVVKVDVDDNPTVSHKFGIRNIPTILFFKNGEVRDKQVGFASKSVFENKIAGLL